jgi:type II secretory pathway component PulF
MNAFRYQAIEAGGASVRGVIEAEDRKAALRLLSQRGLFPSNLELCKTNGNGNGNGAATAVATSIAPIVAAPVSAPVGRRKGISRKDISAFTRELSALVAAGIPIPQALDSLGSEEENLNFREVILSIAASVQKGLALSAAMEEHPKLFGKLYASMVRVGEEAGQLPTVMNDLSNLLEHEDEVRGEVLGAVAYPAFVLCFGVLTVVILLVFVLPRLFSMLDEMGSALPLPTVILLALSRTMHKEWIFLLIGAIAAGVGIFWYVRTPKGAETWDRLKLRIPLMGAVFRSAALGRFARTLGTLARAGISLLPALKIVENTIGNRILAQQIARVAEETRGGDSLAGPLRKLGIFPRTVVQMIEVGEETGKLDEMLLKVADIEERHMRARTKVLVSMLAPVLILGVGAVIGFIVIAILLPIFKMSSTLR